MKITIDDIFQKERIRIFVFTKVLVKIKWWMISHCQRYRYFRDFFYLFPIRHIIVCVLDCADRLMNIRCLNTFINDLFRSMSCIGSPSFVWILSFGVLVFPKLGSTFSTFSTLSASESQLWSQLGFRQFL